jgi:hypothetical protein
MLALFQNGSIRLQGLATLALLGCCLSGCGGTGNNLVPVTGSVSVNGKPAGEASVLFHSEISDAVTPSAVTKADGTFTVMSGLEPGIAPGKYKVTIVWPDASKKPTQAQIMMGTAEPGPDLLKGKYAAKATTKLTAEVTSSTTALPAFEL